MQMDLIQGVGDEAKNIPEIFYKFVEEWLKDRTFENDNIPVDVKLTFQQLLLLMMDIPEGFKRIRADLLNYLSEQINKINRFELDKSIQKIIILVMVQKAIKVGGVSVIEDIQDQIFLNLVSIHSSNKTLSNLIEYIFTLMAKS
mmetsp:Transcript_7731/g.7152  ORF Transcript_7731/g.7152 Transcript_7731/m.7152 type:complete len:144 (-) Transcript_7731:435-866(-)